MDNELTETLLTVDDIPNSDRLDRLSSISSTLFNLTPSLFTPHYTQGYLLEVQREGTTWILVPYFNMKVQLFTR
jgi:hypothetical protein